MRNLGSTYPANGITKNVLVVSPTHAEANAVTEQIRHTLKENGVLGEEEHSYTRLKNLQLTEAQKSRTEEYTPGQYVVFHQHAKGIKAGATLSVADVSEAEVRANDAEGRSHLLPLTEPKKFSVYEPETISLAQGDMLRITQNGKSMEGKHLFNGTSYRVDSFDDKGNIHLSNGSVLANDFGHFTHGYVSTSHSAQGKTADKVILSQSTASLRAASMEQFYVSVSRGKEAVSIYTDDKAELAQAASHSSARLSASELLRGQTQQQEKQRPPVTQTQTPKPPSYELPRTLRTEQEHAR